jgi:uncharacterized protein
MKRAILVHGCCEPEDFHSDKPSCSNSDWFPWLQKQLVRRGIETQTPEMPDPHEPDYGAWKHVFDRCCVDADTALVGHSCGAGFVLRWLSEQKASPHSLFLVAPWLDPFKTRGPFLDFALDRDIENRTRGMHLLYSSDDKVEGVKESVEMLLTGLRVIKDHHFHNKGHFGRAHMGTDAFPELLDLIIIAG